MNEYEKWAHVFAVLLDGVLMQVDLEEKNPAFDEARTQLDRFRFWRAQQHEGNSRRKRVHEEETE